MNDVEHDHGKGGDLSDSGSPPLTPLPNLTGLTPAQRIEQARDAVINALNECCALCWRAGEITADYRKLLDPNFAVDIQFMALEITHDEMQKLKRLEAAVEACKIVVEPFLALYDGYSAAPVTIGSTTKSTAHAAAFGVAKLTQRLYQQSGYKLFPLGMEKIKMPAGDEFAHRELVPKWVLDSQGVHEQMLEIVGKTYSKDFTLWVALIRIEAGKIMAALPPQPDIEEEQLIINALKRHGSPLTQEKLIVAAGLKVTGNTKDLLAKMRQRRLLMNNGKGYFLPE